MAALLNRWVCFFAAFGLLLFTQLPPSSAQEGGEGLFKTKCAMCHLLGGRLVGPDLVGVNERRDEKWILSFVKSSSSLIKSGDSKAIKIFEEYSKMIMPDQALNDGQIKSILAYIKTQGTSTAQVATSTAETSTAETIEASDEDIKRGQEMFQGRIRFTNNGPACNSCHEVVNDAVIGGGVLAAELTSVFSRLGGEGVKAVLGNIPFPVMQQAYINRALTESEIFSLTSFLKHADDQQAYQQPRDYGIKLFYTGLIGVIVLFGIFALLWMRRKKNSVNQSIYDRQTKAEIDREWRD